MRLSPIVMLMMLAGCASPAALPETPTLLATLAEERAAELPAGRAWTYHIETEALPPFDTTVVVARSSSGQLFAAAEREALFFEILAGTELMGPRRADLSDAEGRFHPLSFPLHDNSSWRFDDAHEEAIVIAHAARIELPWGEEDGFIIEGTRDEHTYHLEYSPSVGYVSRWIDKEGDDVELDVRLVAMSDGARPVWFRAAARAEAGGRTPGAATLGVPPDQDAIFVAAAANVGSKVRVDPPLASGGRGWSFDGSEGTPRSWTTLQPTKGAWLATAAGATGVYVLAVAVTYSEGEAAIAGLVVP